MQCRFKVGLVEGVNSSYAAVQLRANSQIQWAVSPLSYTSRVTEVNFSLYLFDSTTFDNFSDITSV